MSCSVPWDPQFYYYYNGSYPSSCPGGEAEGAYGASFDNENGISGIICMNTTTCEVAPTNSSLIGTLAGGDIIYYTFTNTATVSTDDTDDTDNSVSVAIMFGGAYA